MGKRKLEIAMSRSSNIDFTVRWAPYFLRPNHPMEGVLKNPDTPENPRVGVGMKRAGASVDIDFTGKCDR